MTMIDVTFHQPSDGGHEGYTQRARAPMLEELKGGRVLRVLMGDDRRSVMVVEGSTDYHNVKWSKSQLRRFVAELESVIEAMREPNPFHLDSVNLIAQEILLTGSDQDRALARRLMTEASYSDELIDMKIANGAVRARKAAEEYRRREQAQIPTDTSPLKRWAILLGTMAMSMLVGMILVYMVLR